MEEEGVAGVCVADELGLCVASAGDVDPRTAGVLADIARTARIFFAPEDAEGLVTFVETEKTFVLSSWNYQQSNTTKHFLLSHPTEEWWSQRTVGSRQLSTGTATLWRDNNPGSTVLPSQYTTFPNQWTRSQMRRRGEYAKTGWSPRGSAAGAPGAGPGSSLLAPYFHHSSLRTAST